MKKLIASVFAVSAMTFGQAAVIALWDFNSYPSDANSATGTNAAIIGYGFATVFGTTASYVRGASSNVDLGYTDFPNVIVDPEDVNLNNSGYNTTSYPDQGTGSGTEGLLFMHSTVGYTDIVVSFAHRLSNTASKYWRLDYTTDGSDWVEGFLYYDSNYAFQAGYGTPWYDRYADFTGVSAVEDNPNFGFRIVAVFESEVVSGGLDSYVAHSPSGAYGTTGTSRFDMVKIEGNQPVPEPATVLSLGLGIAALTARKRMRRR